MGLYLCIFDEYEEELCGLEVGWYDYFSRFRRQVAYLVDQDRFSSDMSILLRHVDCDGVWTPQECEKLLGELAEIREVFCTLPPSEEIYEQKAGVFQMYGIAPRNLNECFVDPDCECLVDRMISLCRRAVEENQPIVFQ